MIALTDGNCGIVGALLLIVSSFCELIIHEESLLKWPTALRRSFEHSIISNMGGLNNFLWPRVENGKQEKKIEMKPGGCCCCLRCGWVDLPVGGFVWITETRRRRCVGLKGICNLFLIWINPYNLNIRDTALKNGERTTVKCRSRNGKGENTPPPL